MFNASNEPVKVVGYNETEGLSAAYHATLDAVRRSQQAKRTIPLFSDPTHLATVEKVKSIGTSFFGSDTKCYITHRSGKGKKPFTTVKFNRVKFPNHLTKDQKQQQFYDPLKNLGVDVVYSQNTGSFLLHVK